MDRPLLVGFLIIVKLILVVSISFLLLGDYVSEVETAQIRDSRNYILGKNVTVYISSKNRKYVVKFADTVESLVSKGMSASNATVEIYDGNNLKIDHLVSKDAFYSLDNNFIILKGTNKNQEYFIDISKEEVQNYQESSLKSFKFI